MVDPELRVISRDDWVSFKALRLRALADAPNAFAVTLAEADASTEAEWRERAGRPGPVVMAFSSDERPVAMGGLYAPEDSAEAFIWGMWVDPGWRGRGLGSRILGELLPHAERVDREVSLHVSEGNDGARRLYEAHGFVSTHEWEPLREGSDVRIERLRRRRSLPG